MLSDGRRTLQDYNVVLFNRLLQIKIQFLEQAANECVFFCANASI